MTVGRICVREVEIADRTESLQVAALRMRDQNVGTLIVLDDERNPVGILTDRDMTVRVAAYGLDSRQMTVADAMTETPKSIDEETALEDALRMMRRGTFRRLPVVNGDGQIVGLISLDDILDLLAEEFGIIGGLLAREAPVG